MKRLILLGILCLMSLTMSAQRCAVLDFQIGTGVTEEEIDGLTYNFRANFHIDGYTMLELIRINRTIEALGYDRTDMTVQQMLKVGRELEAKLVVVGTMNKFMDEYSVDIRVIDVATGVTCANEGTTFGKSNYRASMQTLADRLGKKVSGGTASDSGAGGGYGSGGSGSAVRGQDFTETAFGINMRMIYVEGGTFTMGCTSEQGGECDGDESPNRQTTVSSFHIGMLEVTQGQWEKVMGTSIHQQKARANASSLYGVGADYPMYYVSWEEAKEFCIRLSRQTGKTYRLPTEAEWEYAARGGKKNEGTKYSGGWSIDAVAWYAGNSGSTAHPCGTKMSNALGLYDMSGNVWEWCEDWYGSQYLQYDNNNPRGAAQGSYRVNRGGSWGNYAKNCRVALRVGGTPSSRGNDLGFRVVLAE